jgi:hypothetical protein
VPVKRASFHRFRPVPDLGTGLRAKGVFSCVIFEGRSRRKGERGNARRQHPRRARRAKVFFIPFRGGRPGGLCSSPAEARSMHWPTWEFAALAVCRSRRQYPALSRYLGGACADHRGRQGEERNSLTRITLAKRRSSSYRRGGVQSFLGARQKASHGLDSSVGGLTV